MLRSSSLGSLVSSAGRSWKRFDVGLQAVKGATTEADANGEEVGQWFYLVVDPSGIRARTRASYDKANKIEKDNCQRFVEGAIVEVSRRRRAGWTTWLGLTEGIGLWLFDVSPKDRAVRMVEVEAVRGDWQFRVSAGEVVPVLSKPAVTLAGKPLQKHQDSLQPGEVVRVLQRVVQVSGSGPSFLELPQGRGWVCASHEHRDLLVPLEENLDAAGLPGLPGESSWNVRQNSSSSLSGYGGSGDAGTNRLLGDPQNRSFMSGYGGSSPSGYGGQGGELNSSSSSPSLRGAAFAEASSVPRRGLSLSEIGEWHYVVLDPCGMSLRSKPTYDQKYKTKLRRLEEGEVVTCVEKRPGGSTTYLRLSDPPAWAFDRQPGKTGCLRMMQVNLERGKWYYRVISPMGVALRNRCSFSESSRCGIGPLKGAVVEVKERCRIGESTFLKLVECDRWVFDLKAGKPIMEGPLKIQDAPEGTVATVESNDVELNVSPTTEKWASTHMLLIKGSLVRVLRFLNEPELHTGLCGDGRKWAYVAREHTTHEGWVPASALSLRETLPNSAAATKANRQYTIEQVQAALKAPNPLASSGSQSTSLLG